jgi:uncharacterized protein YoaH (UPF0181 family)
MGLDTRAFARMTHEERQQWVDEMNEAGQKPAPGILGAFAAVKLEQLATLDDAPFWDQPERISQLDWPGGLIGGMMSGCGDGPSFRGKAYDAYVEEVTGRSLYEAAEGMWEGETLVEVAKALREAAPPAGGQYAGDVRPEEREALARWFEICVENDLGVSGDY